jgi:hypothetical protein
LQEAQLARELKLTLGWSRYVSLQPEARKELEYWITNIKELNGQPLKPTRVPWASIRRTAIPGGFKVHKGKPSLWNHYGNPYPRNTVEPPAGHSGNPSQVSMDQEATIPDNQGKQGATTTIARGQCAHGGWWE